MPRPVRWRAGESGNGEIGPGARGEMQPAEGRAERRGAQDSRPPAGSRVLFAVVAAVGLAAVVWSFVLRARSVQVVNEDAFISFRYARNLLAGDGLVFNPGGERVEGITNLLWTLLLAAVSDAVGVPRPEASVVVVILCGALVLVVALLWCYEELSRTMGT
ncbi:MAG: hypothetical protein ACR2KW_05520, partial [Rubrobacter sp.]